MHNIHVISCFQSSSVIFHAVELNIVCRLYMSANSINYTCYVSAGVSSDCEILSVSPTQDTNYQNLVSIIHVDPVRLVIYWSLTLLLGKRYGLKESILHYWYCAQWKLAGSGFNISHIYATSRCVGLIYETAMRFPSPVIPKWKWRETHV